MSKLYEGDSVIVTNKDGETTDGVVTGVGESVGDYTADFMDPGETLLDYWSGHDVSPREETVAVDLGSGEYTYPRSRVELQEPDEYQIVASNGEVQLCVDTRGRRFINMAGGVTYFSDEAIDIWSAYQYED